MAYVLPHDLDIPKLLKRLLKLGAWVTEIDYGRVNGKPLTIHSHDVDIRLAECNLTITAEVQHGMGTRATVNAYHSFGGSNSDSIDINGIEMQDADVDVQFKGGFWSPKIKYRLEFTADGNRHKIIFTARRQTMQLPRDANMFDLIEASVANPGVEVVLPPMHPGERALVSKLSFEPEQDLCEVFVNYNSMSPEELALASVKLPCRAETEMEVALITAQRHVKDESARRTLEPHLNALAQEIADEINAAAKEMVTANPMQQCEDVAKLMHAQAKAHPLHKGFGGRGFWFPPKEA